jgi:hypothetical protein
MQSELVLSAAARVVALAPELQPLAELLSDDILHVTGSRFPAAPAGSKASNGDITLGFSSKHLNRSSSSGGGGGGRRPAPTVPTVVVVVFVVVVTIAVFQVCRARSSSLTAAGWQSRARRMPLPLSVLPSSSPPPSPSSPRCLHRRGMRDAYVRVRACVRACIH